MGDNVINIVYACDNNFVSLLAASIKSLEINSKGSLIHVYVIDDGISRNNKKKLLASITTSDLKLIFVAVKDIIPSNYKIPYFNNAALPITTFFRLFVHVFLPTTAERAIYIDSDMIIQKDIADLWKTDIENNVVAAVRDSGIQTFGCSWGGGVKNFRELGYPSNTKYFNAGLLVFDLKKWVAEHFCEQALAIASKYSKYIIYGDQYCLNVALANRWFELNPLWNHLVDKFHPEPYLLHYIGNKPIYTNYSYETVYRDIFFDYLNQTQFKDYKLLGVTSRKINEARRFLRKLVY